LLHLQCAYSYSACYFFFNVNRFFAFILLGDLRVTSSSSAQDFLTLRLGSLSPFLSQFRSLTNISFSPLLQHAPSDPGSSFCDENAAVRAGSRSCLLSRRKHSSSSESSSVRTTTSSPFLFFRLVMLVTCLSCTKWSLRPPHFCRVRFSLECGDPDGPGGVSKSDGRTAGIGSFR